MGQFSPQCLFGTHIRALSLECPKISERAQQWLNACNDLGKLEIWFVYPGAQAETDLSLALILAHIQPAALKMLHADMRYAWNRCHSHRPHTLGKTCCTYGIRRSEFLDSTGIMGHILKFTHLEQFTLSLVENDQTYDAAWWTAHISEKLPKLR
ncbi:hypothetical protein OH77DRAFT_1297441 [Trametes cingulata]|nr:hypothetical protein OH77DRAFT_1297441 [Trametes cingulata]